MEHQRKDANIIFASLFIQTAGCEQTEYWKNKIHIEDVWKETYGNENIIVGIIDSGIDITSSDLQSVIYHNDQEISNNQVDDVVNAIKYGYNKGIRLFNCSWDMEVYSEKLYTIMKECSDAIFVCSGGKNSSNVDVQHVYPACFELPNAICVGGLGINGKIYEFSGYGEKIDCSRHRKIHNAVLFISSIMVIIGCITPLNSTYIILCAIILILLDCLVKKVWTA